MPYEYIFQAGVIVIIWAQVCILALSISNVRRGSWILLSGTVLAAVALVGTYFFPLFKGCL
jgi:hypothetical protein